jgi:hypothetical protein
VIAPTISPTAAQPQALTFVSTDIEGSTRLLEELRRVTAII